MNDNKENLGGLIPDFFVEFISRIIPGLVVIALSLYWSGNDFEPVFSTVFSNVGLSVFVLTAAWIIGITLDTGIFCIGKLPCFKKLLPSFFPGVDPGDVPGDDFWNFLRNAPAWEREMYHKHYAQLIFFRNMMSICALMVLICIIMVFPLGLDSLLPVLQSNNWCYAFLGIFFFIVFKLCWESQHKTIKEDWAKLVRDWAKQIRACFQNGFLSQSSIAAS